MASASLPLHSILAPLPLQSTFAPLPLVPTTDSELPALHDWVALQPRSRSMETFATRGLTTRRTLGRTHKKARRHLPSCQYPSLVQPMVMGTIYSQAPMALPSCYTPPTAHMSSDVPCQPMSLSNSSDAWMTIDSVPTSLDATEGSSLLPYVPSLDSPSRFCLQPRPSAPATPPRWVQAD